MKSYYIYIPSALVATSRNFRVCIIAPFHICGAFLSFLSHTMPLLCPLSPDVGYSVCMWLLVDVHRFTGLYHRIELKAYLLVNI